MARYSYQPFPYRTPMDLRGGRTGRVPVLIVGAGPIGLAAAIDLALHGIPSIVADDNNVVSVGSRAICWSKRTLAILDRLGVGGRMVEKGVTWKVGRLFHRDKEVYAFDLLPEDGHKMPAFINLQQYYVEQYLVERCADFPGLIDLRWKNKLAALDRCADGVRATLETPDGTYTLEADYLLACDGARSTIRGLCGLEFAGEAFEERFLITDVEMKADFPSERWFWFEPPFHNGQSALLHKQPDDIYRIDLQLGESADPEEEKKPENVISRIKAMVGDRPFEIDWVSVYTFQCRRLDRFIHDRVIFVGDSAHVISPFGARGGNGGIQDVDNLVWKLAAVLKGEAPVALIDTYDTERTHGADENILNSARSTRFMSPRDGMERVFRDAVLDLAADLPFARKLVNSGRLSQPCSLEGFPLHTPAKGSQGLAPGMPCLDAPVSNGRAGWLLNHLGGDFALLTVGGGPIAGLPNLRQVAVDEAPRGGALLDVTGHVARRYGRDSIYLIRPDQHVAARFTRSDAAAVGAALDRASARSS
jgi:3-(3-hydroxy-phenyl)propionate hydroxylase